MTYLVIGRDGADAAERRQAQREAHLTGAKSMKESGKLLYAVAMLDDGNMVGSIMVFDFEDEAELEQWKSNEPYILGNVWESIEITPCAVPPIFR